MFTQTGLERTDSVDSVVSKQEEEDVTESDSSAKEVFKSIRTRYLSRVHSVSDPPLNDNLLDQAFFKVNSPKDDNEFDFYDNETANEVLEERKTLSPDSDENDVENKDMLLDEVDIKVLAEVVLLPFGDKELKRQDAIDLKNEITRQDAIERLDSPELTEDLIEVNENRSKSESTFAKASRDRTIFSRDLSDIYKGKLKAFSMENINSSKEYRDALHESTSIEFLGKNYNKFNLDKNYSEMSLFTEGSDSVFMSPVEKNNNDLKATSKNILEDKLKKETLTDNIEAESNVTDVPIVKAESLLPFPYPEDIKPNSSVDFIPKAQLQFTPEDEVARNLEKVNMELKLTFKAAIERIIGNNRINRQISTRTPKALKNSFDDDFKEATKDKKIETNDNHTAEIVQDNNIDTERSNIIDEPSLKEPVLDVNIYKANIDEFNEMQSQNNTPVIVESKNPFFDEIEEQNRSDSNSPPVVDDVCYHLKINNKDLCDGEIVKVQSKTQNSYVTKPARRLKTFLTPMKIVGNINPPTSPIIISPVLIKPLLVKSTETTSEVVSQIEIKPIQSTSIYALETVDDSKVYYDDTDQVGEARILEIEPDKERKGIFQKNTKAKPLPFLTWKDATSSQETRTPSPLPTDQKETNIPKLKPKPRTPEWLVNNQYYQPLDNVPFVINTVQTFTKVDNIKDATNINPFLSITPSRRQSEENVYEEIGEPLLPNLNKSITNRNIADDEKISNKNQSISEVFSTITREEILKVPRKPKKPKKDDTKLEDVKEIARITKSVISLSRTPSANAEKGFRDIVENLEHSRAFENPIPSRKLSLQIPKPQPVLATNTSSLPREKPYWKTQDHKRLSHPIRSLNAPRRYLRKWTSRVLSII